MSNKTVYQCLLGIDPAQSKKCNASECPTCGWEAAEHERRRAYIEKRGLTLCKDGLRRLIIRKELFNMAKPYKECPYCGAHLDSGETCDCRNNGDGGDSAPENNATERTNDNDRN